MCLLSIDYTQKEGNNIKIHEPFYECVVFFFIVIACKQKKKESTEEFVVCASIVSIVLIGSFLKSLNDCFDQRQSRHVESLSLQMKFANFTWS